MREAEKRTNVRSRLVRGVVRGALAAAARVSPALGSELAARLFLHVPRVPRPRGEPAAFLASGESFTVDDGRRRLAAWSFGRGPAVLLVHGWGGRGAQMRSFVPALVAAGYRAVVFDGPAHGASRGGPPSLPAFASAIAAVARATDARAAIGHSLGGAATLVALASGVPLAAAVVLGAPASATRIWADTRRALGLSDAVAAEAQRRLEARVGRSFASLDAVRVGSRVAADVLVVHDLDDAEIPYACAGEIVGAVASARLETTRGLGHRRILRDGGVVARAVAFLEAAVPPARCEACRRGLGAVGTTRLCETCVLGRELFEPERRFAA